MAQDTKSLVIIPTYNEAENLQAIVAATFAALPMAHILIIDDNSPDGTGGIADEVAARDDRVHVMHRRGKLGLGTAYVAGFGFALEQGYDCVFEMDADFSHDPRYLPLMLEKLRDCDVVIGSRYVPGGATPDWTPLRRLISNCGNIFARNVLHLPLKDCTAGFKCYRRDVIAACDFGAVHLEGYAFQIETVYQAYMRGFRLREVPIVFVDRHLGHSKMSRQIVAEAFSYVVRRRFSPSLSTRPAEQRHL
jgi:dolichol-phosphate mannosyltransferase